MHNQKIQNLLRRSELEGDSLQNNHSLLKIHYQTLMQSRGLQHLKIIGRVIKTRKEGVRGKEVGIIDAQIIQLIKTIMKLLCSKKTKRIRKYHESSRSKQ